MAHRVICCLVFIGLLSLVKSAPSVRAEPLVLKDDIVILGEINNPHNSIYTLACKVSEATVEHNLTMEVSINGRLRLSPAPSASSYMHSLYSSSLHRSYFLYTTDEVQVACTARYTDGTVKKTQRATPGFDDREVQVGDSVQPAVGGAPDPGVIRTPAPLGPQDLEYITKSRVVYEKLWDMYQTTDEWELESGSRHRTPEQGCVHTRDFPGVGKVYRLQGYVDGSPELLFNELVVRVTDTPKWSKTVLECRVLQHLDASTNILYTIAAEAAGGFVSSRDFVNLNYFAPKDGIMLSSAVAVTHPLMPPTDDHVRGESGPGGYIFKPVPGNPNKCLVIQMINTDLKGWIPQYIVDQALAGVLIQYYKDVQTRIAEVRRLYTPDHRPGPP